MVWGPRGNSLPRICARSTFSQGDGAGQDPHGLPEPAGLHRVLVPGAPSPWESSLPRGRPARWGLSRGVRFLPRHSVGCCKNRERLAAGAGWASRGLKGLSCGKKGLSGLPGPPTWVRHRTSARGPQVVMGWASPPRPQESHAGPGAEGGTGSSGQRPAGWGCHRGGPTGTGGCGLHPEVPPRQRAPGGLQRYSHTRRATARVWEAELSAGPAQMRL